MLGTREELVAQADEMVSAARMIEDVVRDLRVFARMHDDEHPQVVNLHDLIDHLLRLVGKEISTLAVIERDFAADLPRVVVPQGRLTQALTNVLVNAMHAMREVQRDVHRLRLMTRADESMVAVQIADTGPGISADAIERIFDPFFTTKRANLGTGLGLSISRNLMRKMGGDLLVESVHGEGATFVLLLPRATDAEVRAATLRARVIPAARDATRRIAVMVVSDHDHLVRAYSRVLGRHYDLLLAADPHEAIEMIASGSRADVLLVDVPNRDASALHEWLVSDRPELAARTVYVADDPPALREARGIQSTTTVLTKPTPTAMLVRAIDDAALR
jgi:hypothetical protein